MATATVLAAAAAAATPAVAAPEWHNVYRQPVADVQNVVVDDAATALYTTSAGATADSHNVRRFTIGSSGLTENWKTGSLGSGPGQFNNPGAMLASSTEGVTVADRGNARVQLLKTDGQLGDFGSGLGGSVPVVSPTTFTPLEPIGLASVGRDRVFVLHSGGGGTAPGVISLQSGGGSPVTTWPAAGSAGALTQPTAITVDQVHQIVYIADTGTDKIMSYKPDGTFLGSWGTAGTGNGQISDPTALATDADGNVYVANGTPAHIDRYSSSGQFQLLVGKFGSAVDQIGRPTGLAVAPGGNAVLVADAGHQTLHAITYADLGPVVPGSPGTPGTPGTPGSGTLPTLEDLFGTPEEKKKTGDPNAQPLPPYTRPKPSNLPAIVGGMGSIGSRYKPTFTLIGGQRMRVALNKGLRFRSKCSRSCHWRVSLLVDKRTAKRLHLGTYSGGQRRTIGRVSIRAKSGTQVVRIKFRPRVKTRLANMSRVRFTISRRVVIGNESYRKQTKASVRR